MKDFNGNKIIPAWIERGNKIKKLVSDYLSEFQNSTIYFDAVREKYETELLQYVTHVATIQAQMLVGDKVGWDKATIFGINYELSDKEQYRFFEAQKRQADTGYISVAIPTTKIQEWKNG